MTVRGAPCATAIGGKLDAHRMAFVAERSGFALSGMPLSCQETAGCVQALHRAKGLR